MLINRKKFVEITKLLQDTGGIDSSLAIQLADEICILLEGNDVLQEVVTPRILESVANSSMTQFLENDYKTKSLNNGGKPIILNNGYWENGVFTPTTRPVSAIGGVRDEQGKITS